MKTIHTVALMSAVVALSACSSMEQKSAMPTFSQDSLPTAVQVPAGNKVSMETVGKGTIWYECKAKKDAAGQFEWVFGGPDAGLASRSGKSVGKYYGPPATWESNDGSKLTATQVAVAPAGAGNIPYQLVKANPAMGSGAMTGVTYIQRVATKGGVAPSSVCNAGKVGAKETVNYQADYIFWKAS
ncbi:DUF3455 domain-containing protein [Oxalicibacterium faecigallinarum]|uniref:DUF3455 domain-containing protein n=1 Tax=Oxalicibacterium faecigallinarum TaxID=573741 RepID=A0A8J3AQF2_9BURK|nr:DUF3455 domain-containing protein [Oxalicibacterium faecigallinarum]GGI18338.1 hypothetical protein GCM10008066_13510 [Oxalicibacterium faecigallinarum]